ncbi:MAG TPA: arylesterase, partial [Desulfobacteraceae bacterium]|nr:arylesterase [Desulfobacteraceae bacterium]
MGFVSRYVIFIVAISFFALPSSAGAGDTGDEVKTVLIIGDSLTAGLGVMQDQAYPALLQAELAAAGPPGVKVVNGGISGSTSAGAYARLKWYLKARPHLLILALGANDGLRGLKVADMEKNLSKAISLAKENGVTVILAGMQVPPNLGPEYAAAFRRVFPALAAQHEIPLIPFLLEGVAGKPELNQADGIHPNPEGHKRIADTVLPYILENL